MNQWEEYGKEKIRGCPFCGDTGVEICRTNVNACWVQCSGCGATSPSHRHRESAIALWNVRYVPSQLAVIIHDDDIEFRRIPKKRSCRAGKDASQPTRGRGG